MVNPKLLEIYGEEYKDFFGTIIKRIGIDSASDLYVRKDIADLFLFVTKWSEYNVGRMVFWECRCQQPTLER